MQYLGIDTSNYTTSAALYDTDTNTVLQKKKLLPVKTGEKGLRQRDAVFHHTVQLPPLLTELFSECAVKPQSVGVSVFPRRQEGSYMPCFLVGKAVAQSLSAAMQIPCTELSHQEGHIAAALYSAGHLELLEKPFLAFHVSGGTTEALLVEPDRENIFTAQCVAGSLDLKAGQLIDRVGVMLGLSFPCGAQLEQLSDKSGARYRVKPTMKGEDCCLSGLENQCRALFEKGESPEDIARFCMSGVLAALNGMVLALHKTYGDLPLVFSGGVASNRMLKDFFENTYGAYFAAPAFSADNAAGIAVLTALREGK